MPELPEVETIARGLASRVTGDVIESVWLGSKPEPLKSSAAEIAATLESRRIAAVRRVGKHIVLDLESARVAAGDSPAKGLNRTARVEKTQEVGRQECPPHTVEFTINRSVDRSLGHDWAVTDLSTRLRNR